MARILIVDDDPGTRELLRCALEKARHIVFEAGDGEEALRVAQETPVQLIITDILMPARDGLEVIREMKRKNPAIKVIALSGGGTYLGLEILQTAIDFGAVATMAKPLNVHRLLELVETSLS
jgi:DNA-binding NtrC family response regulator